MAVRFAAKNEIVAELTQVTRLRVGDVVTIERLGTRIPAAVVVPFHAMAASERARLLLDAEIGDHCVAVVGIDCRYE